MAMVNFKTGTLAKYNAATKDENTLYFITDAKKIYKGSIDVTENIVVVTNFDGTAGGIAVADAFEGKFYVNITTFEVRIKSGAAWVVLSPGYVTNETDFANASNSGKFATIAAIKAAIATAVADITGGSSLVESLSWTAEDGTGKGKLVVATADGTTSDVVLTGTPYKLTYSKDDLTITVNSYGETDAQVINLPKDNFVRSGEYKASASLPGGGTGPAIVLTVGNGTETSEVVIPAASLVDVYTGEASDNITVTVSDDNKITATAKIDPVAGNALVSTSAGLKVDVSGKADKLTADASAHILVGSADGNLADGGVTLKTTGAMGTSATEVPVASVIATAISTAVSGAQGTLQDAIDALTTRMTTAEGKISTLETSVADLTTAIAGKIASMGAGNADEVVLSTATGGVARSGKKIGGATLAATPNENTLATEASVAAVLSWGNIS